MTLDHSLAWQRYWVPRGTKPVMRDGFVQAPGAPQVARMRAWWDGGTEANVVSLSQLEAEPCLVLLGDMGLGKTTVLGAEADRLRAAAANSPGSAVHYVNLRGQTETTINTRVFQSLAFQRWQRGEIELTLFLDSLDECWRRLGELTEVLMTGLEPQDEGIKRKALRLRLTCRSGELRQDLEARLNERFRPNPQTPGLKVFCLVPLTIDDVRLAATARGLNAESFLSQVQALNLEPLANQPMLLFMLLDEFEDGQGLPPSRVELYSRACLRLCIDRHAESGSAGRLQSTAEQRVSLAARLAAISILGNHANINANPDAPVGRDGIVDPSVLIGAALSGCTASIDTVRETLHTGLFTEANGGLQNWRHLSYPEYLAAWFLIERGLSTNAIMDLITVDDGAQRIVPPALEATAGWLVEMQTELFERLIVENVTALLRCNQLWFTEPRKQQMIDALFTAIRDCEAAMDVAIEEYWRRLEHPGLADQLRPLMRDAHQSPRVREAALDLARLCVADAMVDDAVEILAEIGAPRRVRSNAAGLLDAADRGRAAVVLRARAIPAEVREWDIEFQAFYCRLLWPTHITFAELIPFLGPKRQSFIGVHEIFMDGFIDQLPAAFLVEALQWFVANLHVLSRESAQRLLRMGFARLGEAPVRAALVELLFTVGFSSELTGSTESGVGQLNLSVDARRQLWVDLIARRAELEELRFALRMDPPAFFSADDAPWFVDQAQAATDPAVAQAWWELFVASFDAERPDHWTAAWAAETVPAVAKLIKGQKARRVRRPTPPPTPPPPPPAPNLVSRVETEISAFDAGDLMGAVRIYGLLVVPHSFHPDGYITGGQGWPELSVELRARILQIGLKFVARARPELSPLRDRNTVEWAALAAMHYALIHAHQNPAALARVPEEAWSAWFLSFVVYEDVARVTHLAGWQAVLDTAWRANPGEALVKLREFVTASLGNGMPQVLHRLPLLAVSDLEDICLQALATPKAGHYLVRTVHGLLSPRGSRRWRGWLEAARQDDGVTSDRFAMVTHALVFEDGPDTEWAFGRSEQDAAWGRALALQLTAGHHWARWLPKVAAPRLWWWWQWIGREFPDNPYNGPGGIVTVQHQLHDLRNGIFGEFRSRHSPDAIETLETFIASGPPGIVFMGDVLVQMRRNHRQDLWVPLEPRPLAEYLDNPVYPPLRSAADLHRAILIAISRYQATLHGETASIELWNKVADGPGQFEWSPRDEVTVSDCLKRFLQNDLGARGVRFVREPELRGRLGTVRAQEGDILASSAFGAEQRPDDVILELKGTWNPGLRTDLQGQLIDRYLATLDTQHGIYVAFHFACGGWNRPGDNRKTQSMGGATLAEVRTELDARLATTNRHGKQVTVVVVDASLR